MGILGAHVSISGGVYKAPARGKEIGCDSIQIFTKNQRQWTAPPLSLKDAELFKEEMKKNAIQVAIGHSSYLINIGSPKDELRKKSIDSLVIELKRSEKLGLRALVFHPGSHLGIGETEGLKLIAESLNTVLSRVTLRNTMVLLETTAGQGTNLGYKFEHLADIIDMIEIQKNMVGVCFDTCHAFSAGYDIRTVDAYNKTMDLFDEIIGFDKLKAFHLNDSKFDLGSRKDRHEHIGKGFIGLEGFKAIVNDRRFKTLPMVLETPGGEAGYKENLKVLRSLIEYE
ncbi:MAG: deoxyribonuclease IV [Candidatus Odinarchaeota archaeon]|nr:deoxyribonuclease IV [Candidatus Odinarchaeota archaeon]